jgi:hypothetical protein
MDPQEVDLRDTDWVGPSGAAEGEHPSRWTVCVTARVLEQLVAVGKVKVEDHENPILLLQILQALNQLAVKEYTGLPGPHGVTRCPWRKRVLHVTDGAEDDGRVEGSCAHEPGVPER